MTFSQTERNEALLASDIRAALESACSATLPAWLESRRWFADKGRGIARMELDDVLVEPVDGDWLALAVARVEFRDADPAHYLLPLAWTRSAGDAAGDVAAPVNGHAGAFIDATESPWFGRWLIDAMSEVGGSRARDRWVFAAHPAAAERFVLAGATPAYPVRAEQSNSSLRFGDALMVKLFRRLQPGPNPDEEVLRGLASAGFDRVPPYAGAASWRSANGEMYPIALAQAFVPNLGDGWSWMLRRLEEVAAGTVDPEHDGASPEWLLGKRTGELHVALSQINEPAFAPEMPSGAAIAADVRRTRAAILQAISSLREGQTRLPDSLRVKLPRIISALRITAGRAEGFREEAACYRIRVHGDFHLGQTLRTPDGDWMLIDFEGQPARPVAERREKTSALKDVAGMLRSFGYARGAAERAAGARLSAGERVRLSAWELRARRAFARGYREAIANSPLQVAPPNDEAFENALAARELEQALYEIEYEIRNRPDWIELPLRALLPDPLD